ncbi:radical SAM protein [Thermincola ferriacetica]|uniref:Radical SAM protein n=1 Tax=Thermincola ferriacetica TaxID=281456 RepID=A0A0L6VYE9_9FIRM|nr:radical SAM protein [Thermincola ferriacetica]KNZ68280.1 radical SAM protein [Thermincola ferriacetica]
MERYDVLLINPPSRINEAFEHLGLGYLAACLREKGITVKILNMPTWTVPQALQQVKNFSSEILGISIPFQDSADLAFDFITALKSEGLDTHITIGGIYPTFCYEEIMHMFPAIDSVVLGEGEHTFVELAKTVLHGRDWRKIRGIAYRENDKIVTNEPRPLIKDLDSLPFPARDSLPEVLKRLGFATMLSSRGCYGRCSFCSVIPFYSKFGPKYRLRSSENVMEEIDVLYNEYGVRNIEFNDANFVGGKGHGFHRAREIAEEILKRNLDLRLSIQCRPDDVDEELFAILKRAGLSKVFLGVESGSQTMLDRFKKDITVEENIKALEILGRLDFIVIMGFITFDDRITIREFRENMAFIKKATRTMPISKLKFNLASKLIPLAGTEVEQYMKKTQKYRGNSLGYAYNLDDVRLQMLYNAFDKFGNFSRNVKRIFNVKVGNDRDWMKR